MCPLFPLATATRARRAFTLVELLVVIAIIGVLVALLLPAVQSAREAARRTACLNNAAQIGLALHNFEFHFETLPPGVTNPAGPVRNEPQGNHVSWIVKILPYLEQRVLHDKFDQAAGAYAAANAEVRAAEIRPLECPSDPIPYTGPSRGVARTNYAGCHHDVEAPINDDNHGLLFLNSHVKYADIYDGSSATILLGEALTTPDSLGWASGTRATLRNTSQIEPAAPVIAALSGADPREEREAVGSLAVGGFGSHHPGGLNVNFADGSTRFLSQNIEPQLLHQLGHRSDGQIIKSLP